ncbi:hypothetical protein EBZ80_05380 [bacterium]|nr:hypothetical protein [bacterium]
MCWNWQASIGMFVAGMVVTTAVVALAVRQKKRNVAALACAWYLVVAMQLFEFFAWRGERSIGFTAAFFCANVLQIVAVFVALVVVYDDQHRAALGAVAGAVVAAYLVIVLTTVLHDTGRSFDLRRKEPHLVYPWWTLTAGLSYMIALVIVFLCLGRPWKWSLPTLATILLALLASFLFYRRSIASMWCFFAVFLPILFYTYSLW